MAIVNAFTGVFAGAGNAVVSRPRHAARARAAAVIAAHPAGAMTPHRARRTAAATAASVDRGTT